MYTSPSSNTVFHLPRVRSTYPLAPGPNSSPELVAKNDPRDWGPHLWYYLHCATANFPEHPTSQQRDSMVAWLVALQHTIPCASCKKHYGAHIQKHRAQLPAICSSRDSVFAFCVDLHNIVNRRYGKPEMSIDEARSIYFTRKPIAPSSFR